MPTEARPQNVLLRYFAWLREKTGISEERITLDADVKTVADLLRWQASRGDPFDRAFASPEAIRVAIDHSHAKPGTTIASAREIAFFPPVTGG
jgi:molybdopterin synthase sulfur carrier subunit